MDKANQQFNQQLLSIVERIERLEEDRVTVLDEIKDVYVEAKGNGYDIRVIRKIVSMRKQDQAKRREEEAILELYMQALGMLADTPLGEAAIRAAGKLKSAMGRPAPLTDLERQMGVTAAFVDAKGMRSTISVG